MLDILFLLHIGKDGFLESSMSVVVLQAIGISLCNRIGDSAREFVVVVLWGWYYQHSMYLNCSFSLVSVSGMGECVVGRFWLEWSLSQPVCLPCFMHLFFLYAGFWFIVAYTRGFLCDFRVYTRVYCEQSRIPWFFPFLWKIIGCWVNAVSCWVSFGTAWVYFDLCFWLETFFFSLIFFF